MTKEERDLLVPVVREIMGKSNRNITDDDVLKAMEQLGMIAEESTMSEYFYEHPDYGQMVGEVPSSLCLSSLAAAILLAMGWDEDHLHQFIGKGRDCYSTSINDPGDSLFSRPKDGTRYGISHLLKKKGDKILFEYDYGDGWYHSVKVKAVAEYADDEKKTVRLTDGANACPPDDCGGIFRYNYLAELMKSNPRSRKLSRFYDWMGCKWDPEYFPKEAASKAVNRMNE